MMMKKVSTNGSTMSITKLLKFKRFAKAAVIWCVIYIAVVKNNLEQRSRLLQGHRKLERELLTTIDANGDCK